MNININKQNCTNTLQFKSTRQHVVNKLGQAVNCHYTNFNRKDIDWAKVVKIAKDFKKINVFGCSDASGIYTFMLYLKNMFGMRALKNIQIDASDISPEIIENNRNGEILLHEKDLEFLNSMHSRHLFTRLYSKPVEIMRNIKFYPHSVSSELREHVRFSVKDVREEAKKHDFSDEMFVFRNGWTYMDLESQDMVTKNLAKNSNKKTKCLIGQSDLLKSNACEFFQRNGFQGIEPDVYTRAETDYPSNTIGQPGATSKYPEFLLFERKI